MIYSHYSKFTGEWLWGNFAIEKLSCPCCGEYYHDSDSLDLLQSARNTTSKAMYINSGHRCKKHNKEVGGRQKSQHLRMAFDISLRGFEKEELITILFKAGFTTFGMYNSFIHTDKRSYRKWYGCKQSVWGNIYNKVIKGVNHGLAKQIQR